MRTRELEKLELSMGGIKRQGGPPSVCVVDVDHERMLVKKKQTNLGIPCY